MIYMPRSSADQSGSNGSVARFESFIRQCVGLVGLVLAGVAVRLAVADLPNFAPVCGLALFAGYLFSSRAVAVAAPILVLVLSDLFLGGYQPMLRLAVYGSLVAPVFLGAWIQRLSKSRRDTRDSYGRALIVRLTTATLGSSLLFFLVSNLATWWVTEWYPKTTAGLADCFVRALPFFRYTVAGDLLFTTVLFGGHFLIQQAVPGTTSIPYLSPEPTTGDQR